jgi:hypothetical protein
LKWRLILMDMRIMNFHYCFHENLLSYSEQDKLHLQTHSLYTDFNVILPSRCFKCCIYCSCSFSNFVCRHDVICLIYKFIIHCYLILYLLTPWSRVLLENLTVSQLVKKFPTFYKTRSFIAAFTSARHLHLS